MVSDDGKHFLAHKTVLSDRSPTLSRILQTHPDQDKELFIYFQSVKNRELKAMLDYMYLGSVNIAHDSIEDFMHFAGQMEVQGMPSYFELETDDMSETKGLATESKNILQIEYATTHEQVPKIKENMHTSQEDPIKEKYKDAITTEIASNILDTMGPPYEDIKNCETHYRGEEVKSITKFENIYFSFHMYLLCNLQNMY